MRTGALLEQDIPKGCWAGPQRERGQAVLCQQGQASGAGWEGDRPELGWWCCKREWRGNRA